MKAESLLRERRYLSETAFAELNIWRVPEPVRGSDHSFKYRLVLIVGDACVLRYDNEAGKGDPKHVFDREVPYRFTDLSSLQSDFWADVRTWRAKL